jgi:hypothetical protein
MARIIGSEQTLEVMVNCKTYPAVSTKYIETVCTGGIERDGRFIRLYPVPFRFLDDKEQYERWDVIQVRAYKDKKDQRPESWHLEAGTEIKVLQHVGSEQQRWDWMSKGVFSSTVEMEEKGLTNGLVEIEPVELHWEPEQKKWSSGQLNVFNQGNLFHNRETLKALADRVPWQFKLKFREKSTGREFDQKVLAWSYYQGYRRQLQRLGDEIKALEAVRDRVHQSILSPDRCIYVIFGTHSRFGNWMISGVYHLPRAVRDRFTSNLFLFLNIYKIKVILICIIIS